MLKSTAKTRPAAVKRRLCDALTAALLVAGALIAGCGHRPGVEGTLASDHPIQRTEIQAVPFFPQENRQCGPATLAMALQWSGLRVSPGDLAEEVMTPAAGGSYQSAVIAAVRRHGRIAYPVSDRRSLFYEVAAGHPVIVLQNLGLSWYPVWHYALVVGYDRRRDIILLHSGSFARKQVPLEVFNATWQRSRNWGIIVLPPDRLPATAKRPAFMSAVIGLEQAGQWAAAIDGYHTALKRWPNSLTARIGLANCWYALGDLVAAEKWLREAGRQFPNEGGIFNNLAQVLFEQDRCPEALEAARRAVERGGPLVETYQKTLEEVQSAPCE